MRTTDDVRTRMRRGLARAMKARDHQAVSALRSALAAIDNAEAVHVPPAGAEPAGAEPGEAGVAVVGGGDVAPAPWAGEGRAPIAGAVVGLGAAEVARRSLSPQEMAAIVREEVVGRETAARDYERAGRFDHAERLRAQAELLAAYLDPPGPPPSDRRDQKAPP
jgi:uncharacterized protein YqeY